MSGLRQGAGLVGVFLATPVVAGCYVNFGEKDLGQFAPIDLGIDAPESTAAEAPDGFFGGGGIFDGGLL